VKSFYETVNYSAANEDAASELAALEISPSDSVLCITGSGARVLDLLVTKPARIVAIDFNPCQGFLLELKMAGIRRLARDEFLQFIGVTPGRGRWMAYRGLRHDLSSQARSFWDGKRHMIERGILYEGRWERHFRGLARVLDTAWPGTCERLFACHDLQEQIGVWEGTLDGLSWRLFLRGATSCATWKYLLRDPGFHQYVPKASSISGYIGHGLSLAVRRFLFRESAFATLLFLGRYRVGGALPIHLQPGQYAAVRDALPSVEIVTDSLLGYVGAGGARFDAFSLSDFASYTSSGEYATTWACLARRASPGARICERQFLVKRDPPQLPNVVRRGELERELVATDRSIFYTFVAASVGNN